MSAPARRGRSGYGQGVNPLRVALSVPRDVLNTVGRVRRAAGGVLTAIEQAPELVRRVSVLIAEAESVAARWNVAAATAARAVEGIDGVRAEAELLIRTAEAMRMRAEDLIDAVEPLVTVAGEIEIDMLRTAAARLQPLLGALGSVDVALPADVADIVGRTRPLIEQVEHFILPLIHEARAAIPDVREILPVVQRLEPVMIDVETRIAGLPGSGRMRKRGAKEIEDANQADDDGDTATTATE